MQALTEERVGAPILDTIDFLKLLAPLDGDNDPRADDLFRFTTVPPRTDWNVGTRTVHWKTRAQLHSLEGAGIDALGFATEGQDVYWTAHPFVKRGNNVTKEDAAEFTDCAWVELDDEDIHPGTFSPLPTITDATSPGRHHLYWKLDRPYPIGDVERLNYRLAYGHRLKEDKGGWAITKWLRVPGSINHKREQPFEIKIDDSLSDPTRVYTMSDFDDLPEAPEYLEPGLGRANEFRSARFPPADVVWKMYGRKLAAIGVVGRLEGSTEGRRSEDLWWIYARCRDTDMVQEDVYVIVSCSNADKFQDRASGDFQLWKDICKFYWSEPITPVVDRRYTGSDQDHADRLHERHGDKLRYSEELKSWIVWNGKRWEASNALAGAFASESQRTIRADYPSLNDTEIRRAEESSASGAALNIVKNRPDVQIALSAFDADPYLFNVENGTIELSTGTYREHRQFDMLMKMAAVAYDPEATCPKWEASLLRSMGKDKDAVAFLQRWDGYMMIGNADQRYGLVSYGPPGAGKTVYSNVPLRVFGDYATKSPVALVARKRDHSDKPQPELVATVGMRYTLVSETSKSFTIDDGRLKSILSNEIGVARNHYKGYTNFSPTVKLILETNTLPGFDDLDPSVADKLLVAPFKVPIEGAEEIKGYQDVLYKEERSGILNWMIVGCLQFQKIGLALPALIQTATQNVKRELDTITAFIAEGCTYDAEAETTSGDLHKAYKRWCEARELEVKSTTAFGRRLGQLPRLGKLENYGPGNVVAWQGIRSKDE